MELEGKVAVVTGGSQGIGRACVSALLAQGAQVVSVSRREPSEKFADNNRLEVWSEDVSTQQFLDRLAELPSLGILVNNVGTNRPKGFLEVSEEDLDIVVDLNLKTAFRVAQAAARRMRPEGGVIVNMSSQMGHVGAPNRTVYCMSKHGLEGLTKAMALDLASYNIRVNSVCPTFVETPLTRPMFEDPAFKEYVSRMIPMGQLATPEDVAEAVIFLCSGRARMITGASLKVDGGWTAH